MFRAAIVFAFVCLCPCLAMPATVDPRLGMVPTTLQIYTPTLTVDGVCYSFEVAFTMQKGSRGRPILCAGVTITKTAEGVSARWRDIIVMVSPEATQLDVSADGYRFVLEAKYLEEATVEGVPPREVVTSFGQMFTGGKIGIVPRTDS